jgi:hypothetical protein
MPISPHHDLLAVFRDAVQTLIGAVVVWFLICAVAGALPACAGAESLNKLNQDYLNWGLLVVWIGHLVMAGIQIWGLLFVGAHALCLSALMNTDGPLWRVVVVTFMLQLTVSTISTLFLMPDELREARQVLHVVMAVGPFYGGGIAYLAVSSRRQQRSWIG